MMADSYINVDAAIKAAEALLKQHRAIQDKIAIVRQDLRNAVTMGGANGEQAKWIGDTFPVRERKTKTKA